MDEVYLDNSATTKVKPAVVSAMTEVLTEEYGNPSSLHSMGADAEKLIKESRRSVADLLGANEREIIFTSGGTEANNLAIRGAVDTLERYGNQIITTKIEHASVLAPMRHLEEEGWDVVYLDVDSEGRVDIEQLAEVISKETVLVSIMYVNSEVGTIQPIDEVIEIIREMDVHIFGLEAQNGQEHPEEDGVNADE
ncbi:MAG: cysteine desulfurase family protein, partial [Bacillota bacterium]